MSAAGRVVTGYSKPYIADYEANGTTVTYSNPMQLARGVSVSLEPESSDDNKFYADNVVAEDSGGVFTGGMVTLTVDGLHPAAKTRVYGTPEASEGWTAYGDSATPPYLGVGWITRYLSDGVTIFVPTIVTKAKFVLPSEEASTQEDEIDYQTQELEAAMSRDDTSNHNWKLVGSDYETEEAAELALKTKLGYVPPTP